MNKILFIIVFSISFSYSQKKENFKNQQTTIDYLKTIFCENPFSTIIEKELGFALKIIQNRNKFYLEYIHGDYKNEIKCDGEVILQFDYKHEEIEIYSLTEKEKKECFLISKFIKELQIKNIEENEFNTGNVIIGNIKKNNLKIAFEIIYDALKKEEKKISYNITLEDNQKSQSNQQKNKIIFYEKEKFQKKFEDVFLVKKFNIKSIKEEFVNWEIIDFR